jgi:3D (Asp-Asp-Asp) domain-containing protein
MPKCLNLAVAAAGACLIVGCATQSKSNLSSARHIPNVRTTAYTHSEGSGCHNAIGSRLSGDNVMSAASDWSRYPLGTRFRVASTNEEYIIDDYGWALVGTDTIDLYQAEPAGNETLGRPPRGHRHLAMGIGGTKFESARTALQTSPGAADGDSS